VGTEAAVVVASATSEAPTGHMYTSILHICSFASGELLLGGRGMAARFQYTPAGGSTLSHRAALVPPASEAGGSSGRSSPFGAYSSARTAEELESQNDDALDGLSAKVKMLKDVRSLWLGGSRGQT
jgi:hypothetical protein